MPLEIKTMICVSVVHLRKKRLHLHVMPTITNHVMSQSRFMWCHNHGQDMKKQFAEGRAAPPRVRFQWKTHHFFNNLNENVHVPWLERVIVFIFAVRPHAAPGQRLRRECKKWTETALKNLAVHSKTGKAFAVSRLESRQTLYQNSTRLDYELHISPGFPLQHYTMSTSPVWGACCR